MTKAEKKLLKERLYDVIELYPSEWDDVHKIIDSMTTDTDPRLEVVERIRDANRRTAETPLRKDNWYSLSVQKELNRIESEIKQEAESASKSDS
jgi:hypothetical protein